MKRLVFIILILFLSSTAYAQQCSEPVEMARLSPAMLGSVPSSVACTAGGPTEIKIYDYVDQTDITSSLIREISSYPDYWNAGQMVLGATSYTITRYEVYISYDDGAGSLNGALYTDNGGTPGLVDAIIANTTVTLTSANVTDSGKTIFTLSTPKTGITGTKWIYFWASGSGAYFTGAMVNSIAGFRAHNVDGYATNNALRATVYGCVE